jgi:uncharacterized protein YneF (UPF0154 family)
MSTETIIIVLISILVVVGVFTGYFLNKSNKKEASTEQPEEIEDPAGSPTKPSKL